MTPQQAQKEARRRWGTKGFVRMSDNSSSPERRDTAGTLVRESRAKIDAINTEIQEKLNALEWYRDLQKQKRELSGLIRQTEGRAFYYKFSVGTENGLFATIYGQGDTFEEAFEKADKKS